MNPKKISVKYTISSLAIFFFLWMGCDAEKIISPTEYLKITSFSINGVVAPLDNIYANDTFASNQDPYFDVTFSLPIATASIILSEYAFINQSNGSSIPLKVFITSGNEKTLRIVVANKLDFNTNYTLEITSSIKSLSGSKLQPEQSKISLNLKTNDGYNAPSAPDRPTTKKILKDSIILLWMHDDNFGKNIKGLPVPISEGSFEVLLSTDGINFINPFPSYSVKIENKQATIGGLLPNKNYYFKIVAKNNNPTANIATSTSSAKITTASGASSPSKGSIVDISQANANSDVVVSFVHDGNFGTDINGTTIPGIYHLSMNQNGTSNVIASLLPSTAQSFTVNRNLLPVNTPVRFSIIAENTQKESVTSSESNSFVKKSVLLTAITNIPSNNSLFYNQQHTFRVNIVAFGGASNQVQFRIALPVSGKGANSTINSNGLFIPESSISSGIESSYSVTIEAISKEDSTQKITYTFTVLGPDVLSTKPAIPDYTISLGTDPKSQIILNWQTHSNFGKNNLGNDATPKDSAYLIFISSDGATFDALPTTSFSISPAKLSASTKSASVSGLTPNTSYYFRLVAKNTNENLSFNTSLYLEKSITTASNLTLPAPPSITSISQTNSTQNIIVSFSHNGNFGRLANGTNATAATNNPFQLVAISSNKTTIILSEQDAVFSPSSKSFAVNPTILNLNPYIFKVIVNNNINLSSSSNESEHFTKRYVSISKITNTPALDHIYTNNNIAFSSNITTSGNASNAVNFSIISPKSGVGASSSISPSGLFIPESASSPFIVSIKAKSQEDTNQFANYTFTVEPTPLSYDKIKAPASPVISFGTANTPKSQVVLEWTTHNDFGKNIAGDNATPADTAYKIEISTNGSNFYPLPSAVISFSPLALSASIKSATISGLTPNTTYWFKLFAINKNTQTQYQITSTTSTPITTQKDNTPPSLPTNLSIDQPSSRDDVFIYLSHNNNWGKLDDGSNASPATIPYEIQVTSNSNVSERISQQYYSVSPSRDSIRIARSVFDPSKTYNFIITAINNQGAVNSLNFNANFVPKSITIQTINGKPLRDSANSFSNIQFSASLSQTGNLSTNVTFSILSPLSGLGAKSAISSSGLFVPELIPASDLNSAYIVTIKVISSADTSKSLTYQFTISNKANNLSSKPAIPDYTISLGTDPKSQIILNWQTHSNFGKNHLGNDATPKDSAYLIFISSDGTTFNALPTTSFTLSPAKLSASTKSATVSGLQMGVSYTFRIYAYNQNGVKEFNTSDYIQKSQSTLALPVIPSKAIINQVSQTSSKDDILLTFSHDGNFGKHANQTNAGASTQNPYQVQIRTKNGVTKILNSSEATLSLANKTILIKLSAFNYTDTVRLRIITTNDDGNLSISDSFPFIKRTVTLNAIDRKPTNDTLLHTLQNKFVASISVSGDANAGVIFELIAPKSGLGEKSTLSSDGTFTPEKIIAGSISNSYTVGIRAKSIEDTSQKIYYQFTVVCAAYGTGACDDIGTISPPSGSKAKAPSVPTFTTSTAGISAETQITLDWSLHTDFGKDTNGNIALADTPAYRIEISGDGQNFTILPTNAITFSPSVLYENTKSATISQLTPNSFYWFRLTASNKNKKQTEKTTSYTSTQSIKTAQHAGATFSSPQIVSITQADVNANIILTFTHDGNWGENATQSDVDAYRLKYVTKQGAIGLISSNQITVNGSIKTITILKVSLPSDSCSLILTLQNSKGATVSSNPSNYFAKISSRPPIVNTERIVLGYYRSYGGSSDLLRTLRSLPPYINHVFLSFAKPNLRYTKYSYKSSAETTGLQFDETNSCEVISTIKVLKNRNVKVILSIGGETYWSTNEAYNINYQQIKDFVDDFGFSGIDWDYEPNGLMPQTQAQVDHMTAMIRESRKLMPKGQYIIACAPAGVGALGGKNFDDPNSPFKYANRNTLTGESDINLNKDLRPNVGISLFGFGSTGHMIPTLKEVGNMIDIVAFQGYNTGGATRRTLMYDAYAYYANQYGFNVVAGVHVPYEPYPNDRKGGYVYTHSNVADLSLYIAGGGSDGSRANSYDGIMMWELLTPNQFNASETPYSFMHVASNIFAGQNKETAIANSADGSYPFTGSLPACSQVTYCGVAPWSSTITYASDQQAYLDGKLYKAKYSTTNTPGTSEDWLYLRACTDIPEGEIPPSGVLDNNTTTREPSKPLILSIEQTDGTSPVKVYFEHSEYWGRNADNTPDVAATPNSYKVELTVGTTTSILSPTDASFNGKVVSINPLVLPKYNCSIGVIAYNSQGLSAKSIGKVFTKQAMLYCGYQEWTPQDPAYTTAGTVVYYNGTLWKNAYYASPSEVPGIASVWSNFGQCTSNLINLVSPADVETGTSTFPSFSWQAPSSVSDVSLTYTLLIDTSNTFSHPTSFNTTSTNIHLSPYAVSMPSDFIVSEELLFNKKYYWKVSSTYAGKSYNSAVRSFTTMIDYNQAPTISFSKPISNQLSTTDPVNTIAIELNIVDAETKVNNVIVTINNLPITVTKNGNIYTATLQTTTFGKYLISVTATDDAGKSRTFTKEFNVINPNAVASIKPDAATIVSTSQSSATSDVVVSFAHSGMWGMASGVSASPKSPDSFVLEVNNGSSVAYISPYLFSATADQRTASIKQNLFAPSSNNTYQLVMLSINSNGDTARSNSFSFTKKVATATNNGYCGRKIWSATNIYATTDTVYYNSKLWKNKWYANLGEEPGVADVWQFVSDCKQNEVILSSPSQGATNVSQNTTLAWEPPSSIQDPTNLIYTVYLDTTSAFTSPSAIVANNLTTKVFVASNLLYERKYYWKVTTINNGTIYTSVVNNFITLQDPNQAPNITLKQPSSTQIGISNATSTINIEFDAIDPETSVSSSTATIDGQSITLTKNNNTYTGSFVTTKGYGSYTLVVNATDNAGKTRIISKTLWIYDVNNKPTYTPVPDKVLVGYWHNWQNTSAPFIYLTDIPSTYNVVNVSFIETESGKPYKAVFEPTAPYTKEKFKQDIQVLKNQGRKVMVSIGGENGKIHLLNDSEKDTFVNSVVRMVREYGFDGIDIDYEGASISPLQNTNSTGLTMDKITNQELKRGITAIRDIYNNFGSGFMITAAPEVFYVQYGLDTYPGAGQFLAFLEGLRDILSFVQVQLYNTGPTNALDNKAYAKGTPDLVVAASEMLLQGFNLSTTGIRFNALRPDQVVVGLPSSPSAGNGYIAPDKLKQAMNYLLHGQKGADITYTLRQSTGYPGLRGMMTWSINWDKSTDGGTASYEYASVYDNIFNGGTGDINNNSNKMTAPSATSQPTISNITNSSLSVSWTHNGNFGTDINGQRLIAPQDSFVVQISTDSISFANVTTGVANHTASISGLISSTKYWFRIKTNSSNALSATSPISNSVQTLQGANESPSKPSVPVLSKISHDTIKLQWSAPSKLGTNAQSQSIVKGNETYSIFVSADGVNYTLANNVSVDNTQYTAEVRGLTGSSYYFKVEVNNGNTTNNKAISDASASIYINSNEKPAVTAFKGLLSKEQYETMFPHRFGLNQNQTQYGDFFSYQSLIDAMDFLSDVHVDIYYRLDNAGKFVSTYASRVVWTSKSTGVSRSLITNPDYNESWNLSKPEGVGASFDYGDFCNRGSLEDRQRELAAFLANISHETTGGGYIEKTKTWGLYWREEVAYQTQDPLNPLPPGYVAENATYPAVAGKSYHGRGPIQLSWNFNYGPASFSLFGDINTLLQNPEKVLENGKIAFMTAIWFWMTPQSPKPSAHEVMVGLWNPTTQDISANRDKSKFGATIYIINGGLECGQAWGDSPRDRVEFYKKYLSIMNVPDDGDICSCQNFN